MPTVQLLPGEIWTAYYGDHRPGLAVGTVPFRVVDANETGFTAHFTYPDPDE